VEDYEYSVVLHAVPLKMSPVLKQKAHIFHRCYIFLCCHWIPVSSVGQGVEGMGVQLSNVKILLL